MIQAASKDEFEGLALHDQLPLSWETADLEDAATVEHINMETARALQALSVFEEAPRDSAGDSAGSAVDLSHLEAKIDVLLSLVGRLVGNQFGVPPLRSLVLRSNSVEWASGNQDKSAAGDTGYLTIYPNSMLPLSLRLAGRIVGTVERSGVRWFLARFEALSAPVCTGMEKLVFRRHRRQIAIAKGTGVFMDTGFTESGTFLAPKN